MTKDRSAQPNTEWLVSKLRFASEDRSFPPGSEWLFVKLYGGSATLERVLLRELQDLIGVATSRRLIESWFFIRYADPHPHLRVRFKGIPRTLTGELLPLIRDLMGSMVDQRLWKIEYGTYVREIERYGGPKGIVEAEYLFFRDSETVLAILDALDGAHDLDTRIRVAMIGADALMHDFKLSVGERLNLMRRAREEFARELGLSVAQRQLLGQQFRSERKSLEALLSHDDHSEDSAIPMGVWTAFASRSASLRHTVQHLLDLEKADPMAVSVKDLTSSFIHMHINRLMRSQPRRQETVVYNFLARIYGAMAARNECAGETV